MASRKIKGTHHIRRKLKTRVKVGIGAIAAVLVALSLVLVSKHVDSDKYSIKTVVSRIENRFAGPATVGSVIKINTTATTDEEGNSLGYVSGGGTLINRDGEGNTLTLSATGINDGKFTGWTVNGIHFGTAADTKITVVCNTTIKDKIDYDSSTKTLYVNDTADIEAVFRTPLKGVGAANSIDLIITPNTGHTWIDGGPESWSGFIHMGTDWYGKDAKLILQYLDGGAARAYVYDENMKQISNETGHIKDTADCYVNFTIPSSAQTIYCIPRLNQTDNSCFAIFEAYPEGSGTAGGTISSGNAPFTTQLQATPHKGYKFTSWSVYHDGVKIDTSYEKNATYTVDGVYKFVANYDAATWDVTVETMNPSDGGSVTGTGTQAEGSDVPISITCNEGYELDNWSYTTTDGINHSGTDLNFTIPNIKEDISLYITFKSVKNRVNIKASPVNGGSVSIKKDGGKDKTNYEDFVSGETAYLTATPNSDYKFIAWKDSDNNLISSDAKFNMTINSDTSLTAYFAKETVNIKTEVTPTGYGTIELKYNDLNETSNTEGDHEVQTNKKIQLDATAAAGYHLVEIMDSQGNSSSTMPWVIPASNVLSDETYTAVFAGDTFKIELKSDPAISVKFKIDDAVGDKKEGLTYDESAKHKIEVDTTDTGYKFLYWEDSKGNKISTSSSYSDVPSNAGDLVYTARLAKENVNIKTAVTPSGGGTLELKYNDLDKTSTKLGDHTDVESNKAIQLKATSNSGYHFVEIINNSGKSSPNFTWDVSASDVLDDETYTAIFAGDTFKIELKSDPAVAKVKFKIDGTEQTSKDNIPYNDEAEHKIAIDTAGTDYKFLYWEDSKGNKFYNKEYVVPNNAGDLIYTARLAKDNVNIRTEVTPSGGGTLELKYNFNGSDFEKTSTTLGDHKDVQTNKEIQLNATENTGYHLVEIIDSQGNSSSSLPWVIPASNVLNDETYTAVFAGNTYKIHLESDPAVLGVKTIIDEVETDTLENLPYGTTTHKINIDTSGTAFKFMYWEDAKGNKIYEQEYEVPNNSGDLTYIAHLVKANVTVTIDVAPGTTTGKIKLDSNDFVSKKTDYTISGNSTITLQLDGGTDQEPVEVVDEEGKSYTLSSDGKVVIPNIDKDKHFTAFFTDVKKKVEVIADPGLGGSVTVNGKYGSDEVKLNDTATLTATPALGYVFEGWYDSPYPDGSLVDSYATTTTWTTGPITSDSKYYARFLKSTVDVTVGVSGGTGSGSVRLYGQNERITTEKTYQVDGSSTITVEAFPDNAGKFEKWEDNRGNTYTENPLTIVDLQNDIKLNAVFEAQQSTISVDLDPSDGSGGTAKVSSEGSSPDTSLIINNGKPAILNATPNEGYTFLYWTDSTGAQYEGRRGLDGGSTLTINGVYKSETYTAHFVKKDLTILLESTPSGAGMVRLGNNPFEDGKVQYHVQGNSSIEISAQPKDPTKYQFERWENKNDPKEVYTTNPLTIVSVSTTMHYVAVFSPLDIGIKVEAMPASGGQVTKTYNSDGSIVIKAIPSLGYTFANWKKGEEVLTLATEYTIPADKVYDGDVYTAYFKADPNADPRSDITKENFYREWRKISNPKFDVTRDTMQWQAYSTVAGLTQYKNSTPGLRNFAAFDIAREYFEKDMSAADKKRLTEKFGNSELITAEGEILTPDLLPDFENYEAMAEAFTFKKFGKKYDTEILTVKRIYQPTDFDNLKRTYLWRYTGAEYKDNIYLLYNMTGQKEKWATPIVDEDGVLKFTIDDLPNNDVVAVVRVKLK